MARKPDPQVLVVARGPDPKVHLHRAVDRLVRVATATSAIAPF
jgi:hypothetical protein